jgi:hypothetical protein
MRNDAAQLHAEPISYHLCAPVLLSATLKPSYPCASAALASLTPHELVVSDRIFTDVVLACRLSHPRTLAAHIAAHLGFAPAQDSAPDDVTLVRAQGKVTARAVGCVDNGRVGV